MANFSLSGKTALITGGRRGIGRTLALAFAEAGADVAVCDLVADDGQLEDTANEIRKIGRQALALRADATKRSDIEALTSAVLERFGGIDILVNNAGIFKQAPILETSDQDWDRLMEIDLKAYFICSQVVGRTMVERGKGSIISLASQFAFKAADNMGLYAVAKAGVVMLTRVLARELGRKGVRANALAPAMVRTEFSRVGWSRPDYLKQMEAAIPLGRIAQPEDLVGAALFLASDASAYVNGDTILLDGGVLS